NMIRAGEASGQLDTILVRLAEYMEANESLRRKIKSAMTYPVISLLMIFGITGFLLVFIIPKFQKIFVDLGVDLPLPTRIVLILSDFLQTGWYYIIGAIVLAIVVIIQIKKTPGGRYAWDSLMLKMPVFGILFQKVAISRFSRTFATLLREQPHRQQELWLKRFAALRAGGEWEAAAEAYREARLVDARSLPAVATLDQIEVLLQMRELEAAHELVQDIPVAALDPQQRIRLTAVLTRLSLAQADTVALRPTASPR
ncbi:MAG: type II secretion system F family protein, partial [Planctomycetota bacterium]